MTALRKFLPSESDWSEIAKAHHRFIRALNAPIPSDVLAVMRIEEFLRSNSVYALRLLPQSLLQRFDQNLSRAIPRLTDGGTT